MIGRVIYASIAVAVIAAYPAMASTTTPRPPAPAITYDHGVLTWERIEHRPVAPKILTRLSTALPPGGRKVIAKGRPGVLALYVRYAQRDGGSVRTSILARTLILPAKPRVIAEGIGSSPLAQLEMRGLVEMSAVARSAIVMMATAYTAGSAGGSGYTAIGRRAGYGVVAVDPRVIPLGTHLYIAGYGMAVAGDTGGDIVGNRIDLGFDSYRSAIRFGRREVIVYRLK